MAQQTPKVRQSRPTQSLAVSFGSSFELARQFIDIAEVHDIYLLGIGRVGKGEAIAGYLAAGLPVAHLDAVLRPLVKVFRRDDIATWIGFIPLGDPDLPIDALSAEREVVALCAANHSTAEIF